MGFFGGNVNENVADLKKQIATLSELIKAQTESRINEEMAEKSLEIQEQLDSVNSELQNLRNDYSIAQVEIIPQFGIRIVHKKVGSLTNILYLYR